jgi:transposase
MPKPYSYDLRQKVIQAIELDGMSKTEAAQIFQISRNTINLWLQRKASTGDYQALPNQPPGNGHKITDWEKFQEFVEVNGGKTQAQMAKLWPEEISERTISRALKKIGLTRKKKLTAIKKEMKLNDKNLENRSTSINQSQSSI